MKKLLTILAEEGPTAFGGGGGATRASGKRYERLSKRLLELSSHNGKMLTLAVVMIVAIYLATGFLTWSHRNDLIATGPLLGFAGLLTWWIVGLWREKTSTDLLLGLASQFPAEVMGQIISAATKALESNVAMANAAREAQRPADAASDHASHGQGP